MAACWDHDNLNLFILTAKGRQRQKYLHVSQQQGLMAASSSQAHWNNASSQILHKSIWHDTYITDILYSCIEIACVVYLNQT